MDVTQALEYCTPVRIELAFNAKEICSWEYNLELQNLYQQNRGLPMNYTVREIYFVL